MVLPEELLSLLDPTHGGLLDGDIYNDGFDYLMNRGDMRRKAEKGNFLD